MSCCRLAKCCSSLLALLWDPYITLALHRTGCISVSRCFICLLFVTAAETRSTDSSISSGGSASVSRTTALRVLDLLFPYFRLRSLLLLISVADWVVFITTLALDSEMPLVPSSELPNRSTLPWRSLVDAQLLRACSLAAISP